MINASYIKALLGGLPIEQRKTWDRVWEYVVQSWGYGPPVASTRAANGGAYFYEATTPATPDQEFSIVHGLGRVPYLLIPVLPVGTVNAQLVPLVCTRAADASRVYLSSSVASAAITVLIEG